jgi:hypothetical protein
MDDGQSDLAISVSGSSAIAGVARLPPGHRRGSKADEEAPPRQEVTSACILY